MNVIAKTISIETRKNLSAIFSYLIVFFSSDALIDRNEKRLQVISKTQATPVTSSMTVSLSNRDIFSEVSTTKQKPSRFEDVFSMWFELLFAMTDFC